jgi:hypothetical protein
MLFRWNNENLDHYILSAGNLQSKINSTHAFILKLAQYYNPIKGIVSRDGG